MHVISLTATMVGTFAITLYTENVGDDFDHFHKLIEGWKETYGPLKIHLKLEYVVNGKPAKIVRTVEHLKGSVVGFFARMTPFREKKLTIDISTKP